jgi:hypothetical protein
MNYSLLAAGRTTHLKIVVVALVAAITFVIIVTNARTSDIATARIQSDGIVVKAGQPATYAGQEASTVR